MVSAESLWIAFDWRLDVAQHNPTSTAFAARDLMGKSVHDTDFHLIERCLAGDMQSFRQLYQRHQQRVRSLLFPLCGPSALDDLVQEVFLRVWRGLPKMQRQAKFSTWLYRIAWNVASDYRRSQAQNRSRLQQFSYDAPTHQVAPDVIHLHYQDLVQRGLTQMSLDHQSVLVLHDLEGLTQNEIAEILQVPAGTVKSRLFHARAALRKFLQEQGIQL
jgi:RNA polymerase sigma factor (sigma-70 family)